MPVPATPEVAYAPLWRRLAASIYDLLPAVALLMAAAALWITAIELFVPSQRQAIETMGRWSVGHWPYRAYLLLTLFGYYGVSWRFGGRTLGMRAWRIRVRAADAPALGWGRVALRFAVALVSVAALGAGLAWVLVDRRRRAWHDLVAHTEVVTVGDA
jgi:uncharacterized RDD family membrane protein YckC